MHDASPAATPDTPARPEGIAPRRPVVLGLPSAELSEEQRLDALRRVQSQAENRVKLGMQLFKSAEARLSAQADLARSLRTEHAQLGERVDQRLDALAERVDSLRQSTPVTHSPELLQRLDQLEHTVRQALQDAQSAREQHDRAIDDLRGQQAAFQEQTQQTYERLTRLVSSLTQASPQPGDPLGPPIAPPTSHAPSPTTPPNAEPAEPKRPPSHPLDATQPADPPSSPSTSNVDTRIYSNILDRLRHTQRPDIPDSDASPSH
ncbi:MAG: hypothetical protein AAFY08_16060 [Planctomycetota bacterium]